MNLTSPSTQPFGLFIMHQNKDEYYEQAKNGDKVFFMQKQSDLQKLILVYVQSAAVEPFVILSKAYARLSLNFSMGALLTPKTRGRRAVC